MVFSQTLADRVRHALKFERGISEKRMFGGLCFLLNGKILAGIWQQSLVVRLGPEQATVAQKQHYVREFPVTGRPMKGWIMVEPEGLDSDQQLAEWIERGIQFVETLPEREKT